MSKHTARLAVPVLFTLLTSWLAAPARAAETRILLQNILGTVEVSPGNRGEWVPARARTALAVDDAVRTGEDGSALLVHGPSELFVKSNTTAVVGYMSVQLRQGGLWFRMRKTPEGFKFITDVAAATIRGTLGLITTTGEVTTVSLLRGKVEIDTVNRENYMLLPQFETIARRNRPLEKIAMSGTRTTDLVSEFYNTTKRLGGATGAPGTGAAPRRGPAAPDPAGDALKDGTGLYDPAAHRVANTAANVNPALAPLITVIDNTTNPAIQTLGNANNVAANLTNTTAGALNAVTPVIGGVTGGATQIIGGVTGGATQLIGGVTGGATQIIGGVTGGTGPLIGGVTGGAGQIIGGLTGGTTTSVLTGVPGGASAIIGGATTAAGSIVGGVTGGTTGVVGGITGAAGGLVGGLTGGGLHLGGGLPGR